MPENSHLNLCDDRRVGIVGSNSSTGELTVDLVGASRTRPLNGRMVVIAPPGDDGVTEYGVGTVTEITTTNIYHEKPELRGVVALNGSIGGLTGRGDIKTAKVGVQAVFRDDGTRLRPLGGSFSFSPSTGEKVYLADATTVRTLCEQTTKDLFYIGSLYRQATIPLPMSFHDFSDARGGEMCAFLGASGSGKTYLATLFTGSQFRHHDQAFLLVDPQGQFVSSSSVRRELPIDLRALAEAQGRDVRQISVARQVRLPEDPALFCALLAASGWFSANRYVGANSQASNAQDVTEAFLESTPNWSEKSPEGLLNLVLAHLVQRVEADAIVVSKAPKERLAASLTAALDGTDGDGATRRAALLRVFAPLLTIFASHNADGTERMRMVEIVKALCNPDTGSAGRRKARPFFVLTLADNSADENGDESALSKAMARTKTQMVILRSLFTALEGEARYLYQGESGTANLMVILDEAARFCSDSHKDAEQRGMAADMARYFRELRKYGIGFNLILQEPSALHESIWKQLQNGFRAIAAGLVGNDLERVREQIGGGGPMKLYQQLARPSKDNPTYPWMLVGSISPLAATATPLFMEAFTDAPTWAHANQAWLPQTFNIDDLWVPSRG